MLRQRLVASRDPIKLFPHSYSQPTLWLECLSLILKRRVKVHKAGCAPSRRASRCLRSVQMMVVPLSTMSRSLLEPIFSIYELNTHATSKLALAASCGPPHPPQPPPRGQAPQRYTAGKAFPDGKAVAGEAPRPTRGDPLTGALAVGFRQPDATRLRGDSLHRGPLRRCF
jgi:hypothetical protein